MSFIEKQPDNRVVCMNGVLNIEPVIHPNKFDAHNYGINELLELGETGLLQYNESIKAGIGYEYLTACKNGLYKMYKALAYYTLLDSRASDLRERIAKSIHVSTNTTPDNTLRNVDVNNFKQSKYYPKQHDNIK